MVRRRPAAVIGALGLSIALIGGPVAAAQTPQTPQAQPGTRVVVTDLPVLSELPPLPVEGENSETEDAEKPSDFRFSGVQTVAFVLAAAALVAGAMGLAVVTRRGRAGIAEDRSRPPGPARRRRDR